MPDRRLIRLELRDLRADGSPMWPIRLRQALKVLLRFFGFRCTRARLVEDGVVQELPLEGPPDVPGATKVSQTTPGVT